MLPRKRAGCGKQGAAGSAPGGTGVVGRVTAVVSWQVAEAGLSRALSAVTSNRGSVTLRYASCFQDLSEGKVKGDLFPNPKPPYSLFLQIQLPEQTLQHRACLLSILLKLLHTERPDSQTTHFHSTPDTLVLLYRHRL